MKLFLELFHPVIDNVTETSDLLSFALTCKKLAAIILPNHLFHHTICGNLSENKLWIYLILNPKLCRYIRRLKVTQINFDDQNPKMRLHPSRINAGVANHPYTTPSNTTPLLWTYELIGHAMHQMVNLKAFEWLSARTPVFDPNSESNVGKFSGLRILQRVREAWPDLALPLNRSYVSIFDTPIIYPMCNLISFTLRSDMDALGIGISVVDFLTTCRQLKNLYLRLTGQNILQSLISRGHWPDLTTLYISVLQDHSPEPTAGSTRDFLSLHSNIVSLKWQISFHNHRNYDNDVQISVSFLPYGSLPRLQALEADEGIARSIIGTPCNPPRRIRKIHGFPIDAKTWEDTRRNFQGIDKSTLEIVALSVTSLSQLAHFVSIFPNVECVNFQEGLSQRIFPKDWNKTRMLHLSKLLRALSGWRKLRVMIGFQFYWEDKDVDEREREETNKKVFHSISQLFPRCEYCAADDLRVGVRTAPTEGPRKLDDFTIPEERDQYAV